MNKKAVMDKRIEILVHMAVWSILFLTPLTFLNRSNGLSALQYIMTCMSPLLIMSVFYANYLWLTPRYFATGKRLYYWLTNIIMVVTLGVVLHYWMSYTHHLFASPRPHSDYQPTTLDVVLFILRDIFNLAISAAIATAIVLAMRWQKAETARKDAEAARTDAELKTLRNQINPHFLLNTLNNIYALTAIDATRAQKAIQQLSKMLRHLLYDYEQPAVPLSDEVEFLQNYINLMKIRLPQTVDIKEQFNIHNPELPIAPMIFISLVENAFKHGVSPTGTSFIHISLCDKDHTIICEINNSNHPKSQQDRSGHGIGLTQVQRRLDLAYPGQYQWTKEIRDDGREYHSKIIINT